MMASCKDLAVPKTGADTEVLTYTRRLNYASNANKAQRTTIEKLRADLEAQTQINKQLSTKLDRVVQLCNTRQILIRHLKEDINKMKNEKMEISDENKVLLDEIYELRYTSRMKLSATQEDLIMLSIKNQEDQEELKSQITSLKIQSLPVGKLQKTSTKKRFKQKVDRKLALCTTRKTHSHYPPEIDNMRKELRLKEIQIAEFVKKTKDSVCSELSKLTKTIDEGALRLKTAEDKSKELCKGIIKLLTLFYQRRMARRLLEDKIGSPPLKPVTSREKNKNQKQKAIAAKKKSSSNSSLTNIISSTEESIKNVQKDLGKVGPSAVATLKDVIGQFHILVHKTNFAEELGMFLFNNIVNPFLYESS